MAMALAMDIDPRHELDFSGYSTTTTTTSSDGGDYSCSWSELSPVVDWGAFTLSGGTDDFQELIDSLLYDEGSNGTYHYHTNSTYNYSTCHSETTNDAVIPEEVVVEINNVGDENDADEDQKGLRLVHLLMAAAEALTAADKSHELARVILVRLKKLVSTNNGSNMERLAAYFTDALQALLEGTHSKHSAPTGGGGSHRLNGGGGGDDFNSQMDVLAAFQLMQDMSPYVKFGHFTANQAILEAVIDCRRVHIVDYDIMEGIQWPPLMQALVSGKEGLPVPHLRITALSRSGGVRRSIGTVQETGRRLVAFAASIGLPFSFHQCRLDSDEKFRPSNLKMVRGETLIFNCMLHLPHSSPRVSNSVMSFLSGAKSLSPKLMTLVEEEVGPIGDGGFVGRFMDSLHHYSAMYDSLEAGFPLQCRARALVERVFLGPRIAGSLARIYRTLDEEVGCSWGGWLAEMGFKQVSISFANHCQARLLLGLFNDGYRVEELANNKLVLGWKSRRLLSASIWSSSLDCSD